MIKLFEVSLTQVREWSLNITFSKQNTPGSDYSIAIR